MLVQRVTEMDSLRAHSECWNGLAGGIPFRSWEWLSTWWKTFADRGELFILRVTNPAGELVGIAPWFIEQNALSGRVVQALGSGVVCSDYVGVLTKPDCHQAVLAAIAGWLIEANQKDTADAWDTLQFDGIDARDSTMLELFTRLELLGCTLHQQAGMNCWRIPLPATWGQYLEQLPKPQRKRMRQAKQSLMAGDFRTTIATDSTTWEHCWKQFVELHQRRRQSLSQPGCFGDTAFGTFLQQAAEVFMQCGTARLFLIEKQNFPVATLLTFTGDKDSYAYQMGTNPDCLEDSPGWLLICAAVMAGIERQESGLDLLRGDEPYKSRMGGVAHGMLQIRIVPAQFAAQLRHTAWLTGSALKTWIKTRLHSAKILAGGNASGCQSSAP